MLDNRLIKLLDHPDPEKRKQAIKDIAKTKDPDALSYLAAVFRTDADAEVREMARKAGVYIKKHTGGGSDIDRDTGTVTAYGVYDDDEDDDAYGGTAFGGGTLYEDTEYVTSPLQDKVKNEDKGDVKVSAANVERAQGLVSQAMDAHMDHKTEKAIGYLEKAFRINPNLRNDTYTLSLANQITNVPPEEVFDYVLTFKAKRRGADSEITWGDAMVDLGIYLLVNVLINALSFIGFYVLVVNVFSIVAEGAQTSMPTDFSAEELALAVSTLGVPFLLIIAVIFGIISLVILLIQYYSIHFVSILMLGGDGTMPLLIRKVTLFLTFVYPVVGTLAVVLGIVLNLVDPNLVLVGALLQFGIGLMLLIWYGRLVGRTYDFGTGRGCAALVLSSVFLAIMSCACAFIVPALLFSA